MNRAIKKLEQQEYVHVEASRPATSSRISRPASTRWSTGCGSATSCATTIGKYMTAAVIEHLMAGKVAARRRDARRSRSCSATSASFTSISEKHGAQELVALLNEYFTEMVGIVHERGRRRRQVHRRRHHGGVRRAGAERRRRACARCAPPCGMRAALAKLNERLAARGARAPDRHRARTPASVVAGNIGSESAWSTRSSATP